MAATKLSIVDALVVVVVSVDASIDIIGVILPAPTSNSTSCSHNSDRIYKNNCSSYVIVPATVMFPVNVQHPPVTVKITSNIFELVKAVLAIPTHLESSL